MRKRLKIIVSFLLQVISSFFNMVYTQTYTSHNTDNVAIYKSQEIVSSLQEQYADKGLLNYKYFRYINNK